MPPLKHRGDEGGSGRQFPQIAYYGATGDCVARHMMCVKHHFFKQRPGGYPAVSNLSLGGGIRWG
jgi:hypothetical protein